MCARTILATAMLVTLTGCAHGGIKPSDVTHEGQYRLDVYACAREAGIIGMALGIGDSEAVFQSCMEARGYVRR